MRRGIFVGVLICLPLFGGGVLCPGLAQADEDTDYSNGALLPPSAVREAFPMELAEFPMEIGKLDVKTGLGDLLQGVDGVRVEENDLEFRIIFESDILFDFDRANIRADAEHSLSIVAGALEQFRGKKIRLIGFTDSKGTDEYNLRLSIRRASSVKLWLSKQPQIRGFTLVSEGKGEAEPIAPNNLPSGEDDPDGRQKNRRVEIRIPKL